MTSTDLSIRANLSEPYSSWFEEIKNSKNFESNTETIRDLVKQGYELMNSEVGEFVPLPSSLAQEITKYVSRKDIQQKYKIYSINDFIKKANENLLQKIEENENKNILYFEVRKSLNDEELEIAMAFEICLNKNKEKGVTVEQIASELNRRDVEKIEQILDNFVSQYLLDRIQKFNAKLYHAEI